VKEPKDKRPADFGAQRKYQNHKHYQHYVGVSGVSDSIVLDRYPRIGSIGRLIFVGVQRTGPVLLASGVCSVPTGFIRAVLWANCGRRDGVSRAWRLRDVRGQGAVSFSQGLLCPHIWGENGSPCHLGITEANPVKLF